MMNPPFNEETSRAIIDGKVCAASNASMVDSEMVGYWCAKNLNQKTLLNDTIYYKEWTDNMCKGAEAITLLELLKC